MQRALDDAVDAAAYIARDRPGTASRWREGLIDAGDRITRFPESGRLVPEWESSRIREVIYTSFRVIYAPTDPPIIIAVRHSRRRLRKRDLIRWMREAEGVA